MFKLVLKKKAEIILECILDDRQIVVGSAEECDIRIEDKMVSLQHCIIKKENSQFVVQDLKTAYGTLVNGKKIESSQLKVNDEIGISPYSLVLREKIQRRKKELKSYNLLGIHGAFEGKKYELEYGETRIGRSDVFNEIILWGNVDPSVSRRHATITFQDNQYVLTDKRSRNRTFVNKKEVGEDESILLQSKDEILIGRTIFRFVEEDDHDYSPPTKAGIFLVRFKYPFFKFLSAALVLTGLFLFYFGIRGILIIKHKPNMFTMKLFMTFKTDEEREILQQTPDYFSSEEVYAITSSPAIGDLNNDGRNEIVLATTGGYLYAWSGTTGEKIWEEPVKIGTKIVSSPSLIDMNGDGAKDIIIGSNDSCLYIIDGPTGKLIYKSEILGGNLRSSPVVYDLDGDNWLDIVICSEQGRVYFIYSPLFESKIEIKNVVGNIYSSPMVFVERGSAKTVVGTIEGKLYFFNGKAEVDNIIYLTEVINKNLGIYLPLNEITPTAAEGDLDGDQIPDVVIADKQYYVSVVRGDDKELLWDPYYIEPISEKISPFYYSSPVLTDLDGDNNLDIIVASCNGGIFAIKGISGELLWKYDTGVENRIISSPALADLDKDGIADIIIGNEDGSLYVLRGRANLSDKVNRLLFKEKISSIPITASAVVGDVQGNGYLDIVSSCMDNRIGVYSTNTKIFKNQVVWPMFHSNTRHSGRYSFENKLFPFCIKFLGGFLLVLMTIFTNLFIIKRKKRKRPQVLFENNKNEKRN